MCVMKKKGKKACSPMLFSGCHSGERPKVEKCLAHLLHHPRGEGIPTILKGEIERKEGRLGGVGGGSEPTTAQSSRTATHRSPESKEEKKTREEQKWKEKREMFS